MKLKITKSKLTSALSAVAGVSKGAHLAVLKNVRLDAVAGHLSITSTNLDQQVVFRVKAEIEESGAVLMDSAYFSRFVTALPEGVVTIEAKEGKAAHIAGGEVNYRLETSAAANFPAMSGADATDREQTLFLPVATFKEILRKVRFAVCVDETRRALMGVYFEHEGGRLVATATNGRSLATVEHDTSGGEDFKAIVPTATIALLSRLLAKSMEGEVGIRMSGPVVRFVTDDWCVTSKRIDADYPNWRKVVPEYSANRASFNRATFLLELQRASAATSAERCGVSVKFSKGTITFEALSGVASAKISMEASYEGDEVTFCVDPAILSPALDCIDGPEMAVEFNDGASALVLKCDLPWIAVIMPLRKV